MSTCVARDHFLQCGGCAFCTVLIRWLPRDRAPWSGTSYKENNQRVIAAPSSNKQFTKYIQNHSFQPKFRHYFPFAKWNHLEHWIGCLFFLPQRIKFALYMYLFPLMCWTCSFKKTHNSLILPESTKPAPNAPHAQQVHTCVPIPADNMHNC